jgi:hypothetical protein
MAGNAARVRDLHTLAGIWRRRGLKILEMPGWQDRGRSSTISFDVLGVHHTAAAVDVDRVLRDGRSDVPGPLCNVALHANGDVVLIASGRANHFGVATWSSSQALGVEATGPPFTNYHAYVQLAAGFCEWKRLPPTAVARSDRPVPVHLVAAHKEVATFDDGSYGRKVNPSGTGWHEGGRRIAGIQLIDTFRAEAAAALEEEEEPLTPEDKTWMETKLDQYSRESARWTDHGDNTVLGASNHLAKVREELAALRRLIEERLP